MPYLKWSVTLVTFMNLISVSVLKIYMRFVLVREQGGRCFHEMHWKLSAQQPGTSAAE